MHYIQLLCSRSYSTTGTFFEIIEAELHIFGESSGRVPFSFTTVINESATPTLTPLGSQLKRVWSPVFNFSLPFYDIVSDADSCIFIPSHLAIAKCIYAICQYSSAERAEAQSCSMSPFPFVFIVCSHIHYVKAVLRVQREYCNRQVL